MIRRMLLAGLAIAAIGAAAAAPPLSAYTGHYASDRVGGYKFWNHPIVRQATRAAVSDPTVLKYIFTWQVEDTVKDTGGASLAWGCEQHNCGDHNGTIVVFRPRGPAAVCYHDADGGDDTARWYVGGRMVLKASGGCPSDAPPPGIAAALRR